jgi:hypothetical protein
MHSTIRFRFCFWSTLVCLLIAGALMPGSAMARSHLGGSVVSDTTAALSDPDPAPYPKKRHRQAGRIGDRIDTSPWTPAGHSYGGTAASDVHGHWPFQNERALYTVPPAVRYNRVEGLTIGVQRAPLRWSSSERYRAYGQVGYATALQRLRYSAGLELRADPRQDARYGLKVGARYQHNTATPDAWKTSWLENSLGAGFFQSDAFNYYDAQGWTLYASHRLTPYAQLTTGFRTERHRSLAQATSWSLFGGNGFAPNPAIDSGHYKAVVVAFEGGHVAHFDGTPRGAAFRLDAEFGQGFDNPIGYNRYQADGRAYVPVTPFSTLALRLRGGYATAGAPVQKQFTIGGRGSVRGLTQNGFAGTRTLIGNAEYIIDNVALSDHIFTDLSVIGFVDAGWVGAPGTRFAMHDVLPAAGVGIGFDDRTMRIDVSWPLRRIDGQTGPSVGFRISPSF